MALVAAEPISFQPSSSLHLKDVRVLVVGDAMLDRYWHGTVERISPEAPVPIVHVHQEEDRLGGAANVARNIASLGAQVGLLSVLGQDEPGRQLETLVRKAGIAPHLVHDGSLKTTLKLRVIGRQQQLLRADFESPPDHEMLACLLTQFEQLIEQYDAVVFSDYGKGGLAHVAAMIDLAQRVNKPLLVDPKGKNYGCYAKATVITPNYAELTLAMGAWSSEEDLEKQAQAFRKTLDLEALLLTRSQDGMSLFDDEGHLRVYAQAQEIFDVTGAGDTVIATLATLVAAGWSLRHALPYANRAGGLAVKKLGTATVSYEELFS